MSYEHVEDTVILLAHEKRFPCCVNLMTVRVSIPLKVDDQSPKTFEACYQPLTSLIYTKKPTSKSTNQPVPLPLLPSLTSPEDTFILLDALENDIPLLRTLKTPSRPIPWVVEIGSPLSPLTD